MFPWSLYTGRNNMKHIVRQLDGMNRIPELSLWCLQCHQNKQWWRSLTLYNVWHPLLSVDQDFFILYPNFSEMGSKIHVFLHVGLMNWLLDLPRYSFESMLYLYIYNIFIYIYAFIYTYIYLLLAANSSQTKGSQLCSAMQALQWLILVLCNASFILRSPQGRKSM